MLRLALCEELVANDLLRQATDLLLEGVFQLRSLEGLLWGAFGYCVGYKTNEMSHRWIHSQG